MIKPDNAVPIPKRCANNGGQRKFPWLEMRIGASFVHPGKPGAARTAASWAGQRYDGRKFETREKNGKVRIWRVK